MLLMISTKPYLNRRLEVGNWTMPFSVCTVNNVFAFWWRGRWNLASLRAISIRLTLSYVCLNIFFLLRVVLRRLLVIHHFIFHEIHCLVQMNTGYIRGEKECMQGEKRCCARTLVLTPSPSSVYSPLKFLNFIAFIIKVRGFFLRPFFLFASFLWWRSGSLF